MSRVVSSTVWQETFEVENFCRSVRSEHFVEKTFADYQTNHGWVWHAQNFVEKTFTGSSQTAKFVSVFTLESFLLYGIVIVWHLVF